MRKSTRLILSDFSAELVRRKVYPVVAAYAIVAWMFDITPSGIRRDRVARTDELSTGDTPYPQLYEAYYYYGRTRFHQGDLEGAAKLFEKAAAVNPAEYQARLLRVQILRGAGREHEAKSCARKAIKIVEQHLEWHPDDARALHLGAGSLILLGDIERAEQWLHRALQIAPDDPIVLYNAACNFATLNRLDEALGYLEQAVDEGTVNAPNGPGTIRISRICTVIRALRRCWTAFQIRKRPHRER